MYKYYKPFGHHVWGKDIGSTWLSLIKAVLEHGDITYDERRQRKSIQNVVFQIESFDLPDKLLDTYAQKKNIDALIDLTFQSNQMRDFDVRPSFSPGAKSYHARITEARMLEYVVKRLSTIPESKKAVMSFIEWHDYKAILDTPYDDYLPCHTTVQFRLLEEADKYILNIITHFRSIDAYQKSCGDFVVTAMLAEKVKTELSKTLKLPIKFGSIMGVITDAHVYEECYSDAERLINKATMEQVSL
jgi:thymidylate synthase